MSIEVIGNNNVSNLILNSENTNVSENTNKIIKKYSFDNASKNDINEMTNMLSNTLNTNDALKLAESFCQEKDRIFYQLVLIPFDVEYFNNVNFRDIRIISLNYFPRNIKKYNDNLIYSYQRFININNGKRIRSGSDYLGRIGGWSNSDNEKLYSSSFAFNYDSIKSEKIINSFSELNIDLKQLNNNDLTNINYIYLQSSTSLFGAAFIDLKNLTAFINVINLNNTEQYAYKKIFDENNNGESFHLDDKYINNLFPFNLLIDLFLGKYSPLYTKLFTSFGELKNAFNEENIIWAS